MLTARLKSSVALASTVLWAASTPALAESIDPSGNPEEASPPAAQPAATQDTATEAQSNDDIVITGSRLITNGFAAPTPVTVLTADEIQRASPGDLTQAVAELPAFRGASSRPGDTFVSPATTGGVFLNLRGLGAQRTLVLLDSRRRVASNQTGGVDVILFPHNLIQRVDIVTGGASAAYGSEAVAGVTNFILDTEFEGVRGEILGGIAWRGDRPSAKAAIAAGQSFAGGRGHIVASAEYYQIEQIDPFRGRRDDWLSIGAGTIPNVPAGTLPTFLRVGSGVRTAAIPPGGLITSGPLRGTTFNPDGTARPFNFGTLVSTNFMVGGEGALPRFNSGAGPQERVVLFAHARYELNSDLTIFAEAHQAHVRTDNDQIHPVGVGTGTMRIFADNAFLDPAVAAQMQAQGLAFFALNRDWTELVQRGLQTRDLRQYSVGFDGRIGERWTIDGYYSFGQLDGRSRQFNSGNVRNLAAAVDAVRGPNGLIVCRSTLQGFDPGCVPLDPFGVGAPSQEALDFVFGGVPGTSASNLTNRQQVAGLTLRGDLGERASLGAGPIAVAGGVEYRNEQSRTEVGPFEATCRVSTAGLRDTRANGQFGCHLLGNLAPAAGEVNYREAFVETAIPVFRDAPIGTLDLNFAARALDRTFTGTVWSWKAGAVYSPFRDLRLRATLSRDVRAPNIQENFLGGNIFQSQVTNPDTGEVINVTVSQQGNTLLEPERADTFTVGLVYSPAWLPGLSLSLDYYDIQIEDAIQSLTQQQIYDQCIRGAQSACDLITTAPGGATFIQQSPINIANQQNRGIDFEFVYRANFASGQLSLRGIANYTLEASQVLPLAAPIDRSGEDGQFYGQLEATYRVGRFSSSLTGRLIGAGLYDATRVEGRDINDNHIPATFYLDMALSYEVGLLGGESELFLNVDNLLDQPPPVAPVATIYYQVPDNTFYDVVGRYVTAGVRFRF